ncbi:Hypothetical predicted protein [Podarcis lilfordi]|uniref:Uncharacterized protein n=1 Tax=Podarcis lilfordi TaxID=74358 RepID=A0AA35PND0_9SAUR|nr:Hypothetical predicted protein [Podarcis lilfordi]
MFLPCESPRRGGRVSTMLLCKGLFLFMWMPDPSQAGSQGDPQATVLSPAQSKTSLSFSPSWNDMVGKGPPICPQSNRATSLDMQMAVVNWPARAIALRKELFWLV